MKYIVSILISVLYISSYGQQIIMIEKESDIYKIENFGDLYVFGDFGYDITPIDPSDISVDGAIDEKLLEKVLNEKEKQYLGWVEITNKLIDQINEKVSKLKTKVISKTSEKIYDALGKPNAESTLKKYNLNDWANFIEEYETGTDIEGKREDEIIQELLQWRKEN